MTVLYIILAIIAIVGISLSIALLHNQPLSNKSNWGEYQVRRVLEKCKLEGDKLFHDIIVVNPENEKSAEIDHILLSTRGIFVIETKDWSGDIYGDDKAENWTLVFPDGTTEERHSPVKQNKGHVYTLKKALQTNLWVENIIVFVQGNTQHIHSKYVLTLAELETFLQEAPLDTYGTKTRDDLYEKLRHFEGNPPITKEQHLNSINHQQDYYD